MIQADHNRWAKFVFDIYLKRLFQKSFIDFRIVNDLPKLDKSKSIIVTPNHFSWWDGFFIYWLNKKVLNKKLYVMMLEEQLKRYWFFKKLGCYSIDLNDNKKMIASLKYTLDLIPNQDNAITIFPQGEIQAYEHRPVELRDGIEFISKKSKVDFQIIPVAFKIHYTNERLPIIFSRFGKLLSSKELSENPQTFKDEFVSNLELINTEFSTAANLKSIL
jgi:1-acyl-sn-glycerol-3-phosphate acyltransferase